MQIDSVNYHKLQKKGGEKGEKKKEKRQLVSDEFHFNTIIPHVKYKFFF